MLTLVLGGTTRCRCRYMTSKIALEVAEHYKQLDLPVGVLVIDYKNQVPPFSLLVLALALALALALLLLLFLLLLLLLLLRVLLFWSPYFDLKVVVF